MAGVPACTTPQHDPGPPHENPGPPAIDPGGRFLGRAPGVARIAHSRARIDRVVATLARTPGVDAGLLDAMRAVDPATSLLYAHRYPQAPLLVAGTPAVLTAPTRATPAPDPWVHWWVLDWDRLPTSFLPAHGDESRVGLVADRRFHGPGRWPVAVARGPLDPGAVAGLTAHLGPTEIAAALTGLTPLEGVTPVDPDTDLLLLVRCPTSRPVELGLQYVTQRIRVRFPSPSARTGGGETIACAIRLDDLGDEVTVEDRRGPRRIVDGRWA